MKKIYAIVDASAVVCNLICADKSFAEKIGALPADPGLAIGDTYVVPDHRTPAEKREDAYRTETAVVWGGELLTVTEAAQLWQYYAAEGSTKADELQVLIAAAKKQIRERYPEEVTE